MLLYRDRLEDAKRTATDSLNVFEGTGDEWGRGGSTYYMGLVLEASGQSDAAETWHQEARRMFASVGALGLAAEASASLARCALASRHIEEAVSHASSVMDRLDAFGSVGMESPARAAITCADVFTASGDPENARRALDLGRRELLERAGRITDDAMRSTFLEQVPEHHELLRRTNDPVR